MISLNIFDNIFIFYYWPLGNTLYIISKIESEHLVLRNYSQFDFKNIIKTSDAYLINLKLLNENNFPELSVR